MWDSVNSMTVGSDLYSFETESSYWSSYTSSGYIDLNSSSSNTYLLFPVSTSDFIIHPIWYWRFENPTLMKLMIKIEKSSFFYEDILIQYRQDTQIITLTTKDLINCSGSTIEINLNNVFSFTVKVKRLNAKSNYVINVSPNNSSNKNNTQEKLFLFILIGGMILISAIVAIVVTPLMILKHNRTFQKENSNGNNRRLAYINATLTNMASCEFQKWESRYNQDSCAIWLESFIHDAFIHKTNEWSHIFHSNWLQKWYWNIKENLKLICPCCLTENSPFSEQPIPNQQNSIQVEASNDKLDIIRAPYVTQQNIFEWDQNQKIEDKWTYSFNDHII